MDLTAFVELELEVLRRLTYAVAALIGASGLSVVFTPAVAGVVITLGLPPVVVWGCGAEVRRWVLARRRARILAMAPDLAVRVDELDGRVGTWLEVEGAEAAISLAHARSREARLWEAVPTGDPTFDTTWRLLGPAPAVRARLDAPTRARLMVILRPGDRVAEGVVSLGLRSVREWEERLGDAREVAMLLGCRTPEGVRLALTAAVEEEPVAESRALALETLVEAEPIGEATAALCASILDCGVPGRAAEPALVPDPRVAVVAAAALGEVPTLERFAAHPADAVRRRALAGLARHRGNGPLCTHLAAHPKDARMVLAAADPRGGEEIFIALLATAAWEPAAEILAVHGTVRAVPALRASAGTACRRAMLAIQARIGDREGGGQLSLATGGELAIAGGGEVSVAPGR